PETEPVYRKITSEPERPTGTCRQFCAGHGTSFSNVVSRALQPRGQYNNADSLRVPGPRDTLGKTTNTLRLCRRNFVPPRHSHWGSCAVYWLTQHTGRRPGLRTRVAGTHSRRHRHNRGVGAHRQEALILYGP